MAQKLKTENQKSENKLGVVIVGHVDHGKSTLIGRLLHDTGSLMKGKLEEITAACKNRDVPFEWSFLLDAFQAERDQAITIDTTRIWFKSAKRPYMIIDAPGHREFLKNMISGAAFADAAVLMVDAQEGVREQTKRHAYLLHLLGIKQIVVAINKMDSVGYDEGRFNEVKDEITAYLGGIDVTAQAVIPVVARDGENLARKSDHMPWYKGPDLLEKLDTFEPTALPVKRPLRFPVQDVYRFDGPDGPRIIVGRIASGTISKGDKLVFSPSNRIGTVASIEKWGAPDTLSAAAGESIGITLEEKIFVARGDIASSEEKAPMLTRDFHANIFWLGKTPLRVGSHYKIKLSTSEAVVTVQSIDRVIDTDDLSSAEKGSVAINEMAEVTFRSRDMLALDPFQDNPKTGRAVFIENNDVVGGGIISMEGFADQRGLEHANITAVDHLMTAEERMHPNGHKGAVVWLTGLSGAGKSTLAMRVEHALRLKGLKTSVLDGDKVRRGLCSDLGFSAEDRTENIRRAGEAAALMADAGLVTIAALTSPLLADRQQARQAAGGNFHEVYIKADPSACEPPVLPEMVVDTAKCTVDECVDAIVEYTLNRVCAQTKPSQRVSPPTRGRRAGVMRNVPANKITTVSSL